MFSEVDFQRSIQNSQFDEATGAELPLLSGISTATVIDDSNFLKTGKIAVELEASAGLPDEYTNMETNQTIKISPEEKAKRVYDKNKRNLENASVDVLIFGLGGAAPDCGLFIMPPIGSKGYVAFINGDKNSGVWLGAAPSIKGEFNSTLQPYLDTPSDSKNKTSKSSIGTIENQNSSAKHLNDPQAFIYKQKYKKNHNEKFENIQPINTMILNKKMFYLNHNFKTQLEMNDNEMSITISNDTDQQNHKLSMKINENGINIISNGELIWTNKENESATRLVRYKEFEILMNAVFNHIHLAQGPTGLPLINANGVTVKSKYAKDLENAKAKKFSEVE